jgi:hypothetical protein
MRRIRASRRLVRTVEGRSGNFVNHGLDGGGGGARGLGVDGGVGFAAGNRHGEMELGKGEV